MWKAILLAAVFAWCILSQTEAKEENIGNATSESPTKNLTTAERWENMETEAKKLVNAGLKMVLPKLMREMSGLNLSGECIKNSMHLIAGLKSIKPWAMRFLDSSAKMMDGVLTGSLSSLGDYDECVNTEVKSTRPRDKEKLLFRGQYCTIEITPPLPPKSNFYGFEQVLPGLKNISQRDTVIGEAAKMAHYFHVLSLRLGICAVSGCTLEDVSKVVKKLNNYIPLNATVSRCEIKQENDFNSIVIAVMTIYSFTGFLALVGSSVDLYAHYRKVIVKHKILRILLAFSIISNFKKFVSTKTASDSLNCLNGIRFFSMTWLILVHTYFIANKQTFTGLTKTSEFAKDFAFQAIVNASVVVDTFFCIGGLLVSYLTIKLVLNQGQKLNVGLYIFHRLWRILPVYAYVIMFAFLINLFGSGPIWHETTHGHIQACYDNWWTNFLFINNFYDAEHMCVPQGWYIASDFQLYLFALVILLPTIRHPRIGVYLCILGIVASIVYSGVATYVLNLPPALLMVHPDPDQRLNYLENFYFRPFVHAGPYCMGLLSGYILATWPKLKISAVIQVVGWCLAFIFNFSVLYGVHEWDKGVEPTLSSTLLYASLNRVAWAMGVAWMVVCCATGHGGVINYILSWKVFVPLSRLTFVAYLVHPIVQIIMVGSLKTRIQLDHFILVWQFLGHLCVTYAAAFLGNMLIESPFISLEKLILKREEKNEANSVMKQNSNLNGTLSEKNGDISIIVPKTDERSDDLNSR